VWGFLLQVLLRKIRWGMARIGRLPSSLRPLVWHGALRWQHAGPISWRTARLVGVIPCSGRAVFAPGCSRALVTVELAICPRAALRYTRVSSFRAAAILVDVLSLLPRRTRSVCGRRDLDGVGIALEHMASTAAHRTILETLFGDVPRFTTVSDSRCVGVSPAQSTSARGLVKRVLADLGYEHAASTGPMPGTCWSADSRDGFEPFGDHPANRASVGHRGRQLFLA